MSNKNEINYTQEDIDRMMEVYDPTSQQDARDEQVAQLSAELNKPLRSIRAKLAQKGVYVSKTKEKAAKNSTRKSEQVQTIAHKLNADPEEFASLEKANKVVLSRLTAALTDKGYI